MAFLPAGTCFRAAGISSPVREGCESRATDSPGDKEVQSIEPDQIRPVAGLHVPQCRPFRTECAGIAAVPPPRFLRARRTHAHSGHTPQEFVRKIPRRSLRLRHMKAPARASAWRRFAVLFRLAHQSVAGTLSGRMASNGWSFPQSVGSARPLGSVKFLVCWYSSVGFLAAALFRSRARRGGLRRCRRSRRVTASGSSAASASDGNTWEQRDGGTYCLWYVDTNYDTLIMQHISSIVTSGEHAVPPPSRLKLVAEGPSDRADEI